MDFDNNLQAEIEQENNFDIKAEFFKVLSFWKLFAVVVFISLLLAFLYLSYTKPAYKITSTILIKDDSKSRAGGSSLLNELDVFKQQSNPEINVSQMGHGPRIVARLIKPLELICKPC